MGTAGTRVPEGRYGRSSDARTDRRLTVLGMALGGVLVVVVGWFGYHHVVGAGISAEVITFRTEDDRVQVHLEVRKDSGTTGYCTLRSQSADGAEVGRADFRFSGSGTRIDEVVTLRTTTRGTTAELVGCHED